MRERELGLFRLFNISQPRTNCKKENGLAGARRRVDGRGRILEDGGHVLHAEVNLWYRGEH